MMELDYDEAITKLHEENLALKEQLCALEHLLVNGSPDVNGEKDDIIATVIYHDLSAEKRKKLESFISSLRDGINDSEIDIDDDDGEEETYQPNSLSMCGGKCSDQLNCTCQSRTMKLTGAIEYHNQYVLDLLGVPMIIRGDTYTLPDELRVPYEQVYFQPFWTNVVQDEFKLRKAAVRKCFNCGECHHMRDCSKPVNPFAVARNKMQFQEETGSLGADKRYYLELESQERFSKFQPGKISDKLRAALSLQDGECPIFINRMREYGYPPGWKLFREETLKMFDSTGEEIPSSIFHEDIIFPGYNDKTLLTKQSTDESATMCMLNGRDANEDDLGQLGDYEFDMEEEGGFVLRKLIKQESNVADLVSDSELKSCTVVRSLDFPPGLVEVDNPTQSRGRWMEIVKIIENQKWKK